MRSVSPFAFYSAVAAAVPAIARIVPLDHCEALVPRPRLPVRLAAAMTPCPFG